MFVFFTFFFCPSYYCSLLPLYLFPPFIHLYILRIWCPNIIYNKDLWKVTGQEDINVEIRKRKFWMDRSRIKKRGWRDTKGCPTLEPSRKQEERKTKK
jgi:hypothetical protein